MKVQGKVYLGGYEVSYDEFAWCNAHQVNPSNHYWITENGEFETGDDSGIVSVYAAQAATYDGLLDDAMNDYIPDVDIIDLSGAFIIELAQDKLDTFEDVYYAYKKRKEVR
jgi:hypothetical protein